MPVYIPKLKYRWLLHNSVNHVLYEKDGDYYRTLCNEILRGGEVFHAGIIDVKQNKCKKCAALFKKRFFIDN